MSETEEHDETKQGVYEQPAGDQHDNAQPLDHHGLDDAKSVGKKASEDLHDGESGDEELNQ